MLNHLSQCAECREVAALALPAEVAAAEAPRGAAWRRSNPWLVLRWGAMAAVVGALALVVVLHPAMWNQHPEISKEMPPQTPAGNFTPAPQPAAAPPSAPAHPENARAKGQVQARESAGERAAIGSASGSNRDSGMNDYVRHAPANAQILRMASPQPTATLKAQNAPATSATQEGRGERGLTAGAVPAPPSPPAPANEPLASSDQAGKVTGESHGGLQTMRATTQSVAVGGRNSGVGAAQVTVAKAAPRAAARAPVQVAAQARMSEMAASRQVMKLVAAPPTALWSVSTDGKVQRSVDSGKTFEPVPVAPGIRFQAIAASGNDVWAGGAGGALFHSLDAGATWTQVAINSGGNTVTETVAAIQLRDPQHLTVTTASGSSWISEDAGQHWRKQP